MNKETAIQEMLNALKGFHLAARKLYGQVSMRLDDKTYLMTGDNRLLSGIVEDDMQICDINSGDLGDIFVKRPEINAFVFACSQESVAVSGDVKQLDVALEDLAQLTGSAVKIAKDSKPASILSCLKTADVCLVKGVGGVAVGRDVRSAIAAANVLEKSCQAFILGKKLGGVKVLDKKYAKALRDNYENRYVETNDKGHVDFVGFDEERFKLRGDIVEFGRKMIRDDLAYGSGGNLSMKFDDNRMLINPSAMDYFDINVEDVVVVDMETLDHGDQRVPSSDASVHAVMYKSLPGCGAIIHTHSNACSAFAACEAGFGMADPNLKRLIGDVKVVPYTPGNKESTIKNLLATLSTTHAAIMPHHGAIFYGPSLEITYEIAKNVELMAKNILSPENGVKESEA